MHHVIQSKECPTHDNEISCALLVWALCPLYQPLYVTSSLRASSLIHGLM